MIAVQQELNSNSSRPGKSLVLKPLLALGVASGLSLLIYLVWLVMPINLLELYDQQRLDAFYLERNQPFNQVRLLMAVLLLGGLYVWGWSMARKVKGRLAWIICLGGAITCAISLLFMAPFDAADIYDNIMHARITGVYDGNPFVQVGRNFRNDPFYPYMAWKEEPSAYGPLWELLAGGAAKLAGDRVVANVLIFKLLPGAFWLASLGAAAVFMNKVDPQQALPNTYLLAWNPVVLFSTWGNGHNDMTIVFWILLAALAVQNRRFTIAVLSLLVGALFKYIPLLLIPPVIAIALSNLRGYYPRLRYFVLTGILGVALVWTAYLPFWKNLGIFSLERRTQLVTSSLPAIFFYLIEPIFGKETPKAISLIAVCLTAIFTVGRGWLAQCDNKWSNFPKASFDILTFYLLVTCLWFQHWYTIWLIGAAALLPRDYRQRFAVFFSLAVFSKPLLVGLFLFKPKPIYPQPWFEIIFTLGVLGLPWLYWIAAHSTASKEVRCESLHA